MMYNGSMAAPAQNTPTLEPQILIIAGPNGAGKTTFAREFLINEANCPRFVNADLMAGRPESFPARESLNSRGSLDAEYDP